MHKKNYLFPIMLDLASRFETLAMAFMIKDYFGHEIILDWPDLDDFNVLETKKR